MFALSLPIHKYFFNNKKEKRNCVKKNGKKEAELRTDTRISPDSWRKRVGQCITVNTTNDPFRAFLQDPSCVVSRVDCTAVLGILQILPACLQFSEQHFEVAYYCHIHSMRVIRTGETTEETEPQSSRGQTGVGWLQDSLAARGGLPS